MPKLGDVSVLTIGTNSFDIKDATLTTVVNEIIEAIGINNENIAERINNLNDRSFDALIKISSQEETEIVSIQDGMYKLQYVTVTGEGDEAVETLNNSAILIQKGTNQYLYKDGQLSTRTKENNSWGTWIIDTHPVTSVNGMTGAVTIQGNIKPDWEAVSGSDAEILNKPDLSNFLTIETQSNWNETNTSSAAYIQNKPIIVNSVNGQTGAVVVDIPVTSVNGQTGAVVVDVPVISVNGQTGAVNLTIPTVPTTSTSVVQNDNNPVSGGAVYQKFEDLIGSAPAALDTLEEIAAALNNDEDLAGTLTTQISSKIPKVSNPTTDNFASFNSDGTIKDSGHSHSDYITSIKTVNNESLVGTGNVVIPGLPLVTSADNGKILMVVNGQWQLVYPSTLYSGSGIPNNANGNNGDLYTQTD